MYLFIFLMWKAEVSLKATLLPPACLDPPPLSVVLASSIVQALQPRLAFCQPPFLCQSDAFCQVPDMLCPHAHKYPRAERGERRAHSDHELHLPVPGHTRRGHSHHNQLLPLWRGWN